MTLDLLKMRVAESNPDARNPHSKRGFPTNVKSQPLFIVGAPRSGTTFLCHLLNQHPSIQLTNESRVFVWLKDIIDDRILRPHLIGSQFQDQFAHYVRRSAGNWIESFYREQLGVTAPIWGDKNPPYADPAVLSGREGSEENLPRSGSCLRLIRSCLPDAKFIHIHRDPSRVAYSLFRKRWTPSIEDAVQVWRQYVAEILEFFSEINTDRCLTLAYGDLLKQPEAATSAIGRFLGLTDSTPIKTFLTRQRHSPIPFSDPVTDLSATYLGTEVYPDGYPNGRALALAGETAELLGYVHDRPGGSRTSP
jgi:hypothetical protein